MAKKILLADDSLTIQKVVELTFSDSEYELICVSNGQKALEKIRDDRPDLVLADVVMPEKNGYEVCEAVKSNPATARIPVLLLSGTFEPFDRERAERIGADAIVSKPFDSQQLIAQVEALLDRASPAILESPSSGQTTVQIPVTEPQSLHPAEPEEGPFDVGFSAEDFTAAVRIPSRGIDPFEEEYGRGGLDSAIEAFESQPPAQQTAAAAESIAAEPPPSTTEEEVAREPQWLGDEPEKPAEAPPSPPEEYFAPAVVDMEATVAVRLPLPETEEAAGSATTAEIPQQPMETVEERPAEVQEDLFEAGPPSAAVPQEELPSTQAEASAEEAGEPAEVPREIEMLAQTSSIPELTQMLSSVAKASGSELSDEQIEKLARRVMEKLSDRIVREIAWEVIPDMAEIVIKQRIKELEAGIE